MKKQNTKQQALHAAQMIVDAYRAGEENGGSVDWNDLNIAWQAAKLALKYERVELRKKYGRLKCAAPKKSKNIGAGIFQQVEKK